MKPEQISPTIDTRRLTWLYILALGMVGLLTVVGQLAVQISLMRLQSDARVVNLAGRQRMLSQRLPLLVYTFQFNDRLILEQSLSAENRRVSRQALIQELNDLLKTWETSHRGLQSGSTALGLPGNNSPAVAEAFREVETHFRSLQSIIDSFAETHTSDEPALTLTKEQHLDLVQHSKGFLSGMDRIVSLYEAEASARVTQLKFVERSLLVATLLVLVLEGAFIFSPAISTLRRAFDELTATSGLLAVAKQSAEAANIAKTEFLTRVSHELRTPLHGILGMLDLVKRGRLTKSQRRKIRLASEASGSLRRLVDDLLDVAGIESGKALQLQLSEIDLHQTVTDVVDLMTTIAHKKGLQTECQIASDVPRWVCVDGDRLRQSLTNLLQNAIRYTDKGSVQCLVRNVDASVVHDETLNGASNLVFEIRDTGRGIAASDQQRIFESFVRAETSDQHADFGPGLGLGLTITTALIRQMGGSVQLESEVNQGTVVRVFLPVLPVMKAANRRVLSQVNPGISSTTRTKVLVVDDSRINRILMKEFLKRLQCRTKSAATLESARSLILRSKPDILLLDRHLPDGDGLEFARSLKTSLSKLPTILLVTADIHFETKDLLPEDPVSGILHKPLELHELQRTLHPHLLEGRDESVSPSIEVTKPEFDDLKSKLLKALQMRLPDEIGDLRRSIQAEDYRMVQIVAHRIKGSSANVDWHILSKTAGQLEAAAELKRPDEIRAAFEKLLSSAYQAP